MYYDTINLAYEPEVYAGGKNMRSVILVDDEYWPLKGLERIFDWEKHGYIVTGSFEDPFKALHAIENEKPDLVLTDIRMPGMDGIELIRQAKDAGALCVFVIISGYSEFEYAREALKCGAFDYLLKPVSYADAEALIIRIDEYFAGLDKKAGETSPESVPETSNEQFNSLLQYMRTHYAEHLQLKELAKKFYLNPTYCSELFNKKLGISFSRYLNQLRINHCCTLLRTSAKSVEEIADQTGFADSTHFHKIFKSITGVTPGHYRKTREDQ